MSQETLVSAVKRKWGSLLLVGLFAGSVAFFSLVFFSKHFKVSTDFLVVQTGAGQSQDFYALLKSSEYLGKVLTQSVGSEKFIGAVVETGGVDGNFLPSNPKDRLKAWDKMVKVSSNPDVGSLHIAVYADSDREALRVAQAVGQVLTEKNSLFRSGDEKSVEIRTLSGPIVERNPEVEALAAASVAGFAFGVSLFLLFLFVREEAKLKELAFTGTDESIETIQSAPISPEPACSNSNQSNEKEHSASSNEEPVSGRAYPGSHLAFDKE